MNCVVVSATTDCRASAHIIKIQSDKELKHIFKLWLMRYDIATVQKYFNE